MWIQGFPAEGYPTFPDQVTYRLVNSAVNVDYHERLMRSVVSALESAGVPHDGPVNTNAFNVPERRPSVASEGSGSASSMVAHFSRYSLCLNSSPVSAHGSSLEAEGQPFGEYVGNRVSGSASSMIAHFSRYSLCSDSSPVSAHGSSLEAEGQPFGEYVGNRVGEASHPGRQKHPNHYRRSMAFKPFTERERAAMDSQRQLLGHSFYKSQGSIDQLASHWQYHASRAGVPFILQEDDPEEVAIAFRKAAVDFALLELVDHAIRGDSLQQKFWAIRKSHSNRFQPDPFEGCFELLEILRRAKKLDPESKGKLPVTISLLIVLFSLLDPRVLEHRVLKAYYLHGFAYGNRVSEIAVGELYTMRWQDVHFYLRGTEVDILAREADGSFSLEPDELESIQQADKVTRRGRGVPRSHTLNDSDSDLCVVRAICSLKRDLESVNMARPEDPLFSWAPGKGVTRRMASAILKQAATACGIPAADISNHSLRAGAMTAFRAAGIPWRETKLFLRWKSDSAAELYEWPHTQIVAGMASRIFSSAPIHRMRGLFVHCMGGLAGRGDSNAQ